MNEQIFAYVDGVPTKGKWIDLQFIDSWDEVKQELADDGFCEEYYDGDILVADSEGDLVKAFVDQYGGFSLDSFVETRDNLSEDCFEAFAAYCSYFGGSSVEDFENAYRGEYKSEIEFTEQFIDDCGLLESVPDRLKGYFNTEEFSRDIFINDFTFTDGFVFSNY